MAALTFDAPRAAIVLIDGERPWLKAHFGSIEETFLRAQLSPETMLARAEPVFLGDLRKVKAPAGAAIAASSVARFYASAPLVASDGAVAGALVVTDDRPHAPNPRLQKALLELAALASQELIRDGEARATPRPRAFDTVRLGLALDAARLGVYEWDLAARTVFLSERLRTISGVAGEQVSPDQFRKLLHPDDGEQVIAAIKAALETSGAFEIEHRLKRPSDGVTIWAITSGLLTKGDSSDPGCVIGVVRDITPRKIAEEQRESLVNELDHRIKNVLSAVQSMAAQSARKASSPEGFLKTFGGRLKSMASAHQLLTATRWRGAGMQNIATAELGGIAPGQTRWEGPDLLLAPRAAGAMSLALHELATNAVKFGALSVEAGRVDVRWRSGADGGVELRWSESGGPPVSPPTRRGFGATLLEKVTGRELDGSVSVEHRREGVTVLIKAGPTALAPPPMDLAGPDVEPAPAPLAHAATPAAYQTGSARIDGLRLLIVEDALLLALELEAGLQEAGAIMVGSAAHVEEALAMMDRPIDAAVLDANLNGHSVLPVAQALADRGIPFVFATGYGDNRFNPEGFDAPVIRKPYDVTQVAAALAEITGRA